MQHCQAATDVKPHKQAAAAQRAGRPDEAEALYTAALAADADDRAASPNPQGQGELRL